MKWKPYLDGKIRLIRQWAGVAVRRDLIRDVQPVLDEVSCELIIQSFLSVQVVRGDQEESRRVPFTYFAINELSDVAWV